MGALIQQVTDTISIIRVFIISGDQNECAENVRCTTWEYLKASWLPGATVKTASLVCIVHLQLPAPGEMCCSETAGKFMLL